MTDDHESTFDRDPIDWTDREIEVGLAIVGRDLEWFAETPAKRELYHRVAVELADERDRRAAVGHAVDMAVEPAVWLDDVS